MRFVTDLMWECLHGPPLENVMVDNTRYVVCVNSVCGSNLQNCLEGLTVEKVPNHLR